MGNIGFPFSPASEHFPVWFNRIDQTGPLVAMQFCAGSRAASLLAIIKYHFLCCSYKNHVSSFHVFCCRRRSGRGARGAELGAAGKGWRGGKAGRRWNERDHVS